MEHEKRLIPEADYKKPWYGSYKSIFLEWNGQRKSVHQWAEELGVSASTLKNRYYLGWSVEEILTLSVSRRKPRRGNVCA